MALQISSVLVYAKVLNEDKVYQSILHVPQEHKAQGFTTQQSLCKSDARFPRYSRFPARKLLKLA